MKLFYTIGVNLYSLSVLIFSLWDQKAKSWISGRNKVWNEISKFNPKGKVYWFHCASLGEFEQARPLIEELKNTRDCQIVITFFSPSGYEIRKNYEKADLIIYLPKDSKRNAVRFLNIIKPSRIFFIKYEFWANYVFESKKRNIPIYSISAVFRKNQIFFKWYGGFMRRILSSFSGIFVQDNESKQLLDTINILSEVSGDTRYDRVAQNASNVSEYPEILNIVQKRKVLICGSVWKDDMDVIGSEVSSLGVDWFIIIAPHEISEKNIGEIENYFSDNAIRYSELSSSVEKCKCLIIDNIGMLMNLYQYGDLAYVGGAFKTGLHNILEPASFGIPVIFGPKHDKFPEAYSFINAGIGFSISTDREFHTVMEDLMKKPISDKVVEFMKENRGATNFILGKVFD